MVVLVVGGLVAGIWLDGQLGTRPAFTLTLILLSIPVSLFLTVRSVLGGVRAIQSQADQASPAGPDDSPEEEEDS